MFDFAWSELAIIGVVAILVIGPKDLPAAIKTVREFVRKARGMAAEFQTHVDEMMKDADLQDVRQSINELRNFDLKGVIEKEIDADGSLRSTLADLPLAPAASADTAAAVPPAEELAPVTAAELAPPEPVEDPTPAFIPPQIAHPPPVPDFLPPGLARV